jgi:hypothetical protein
MAIVGGMHRMREKIGITSNDATGEEFHAVRSILCSRLLCLRGPNHKQFEDTMQATELWNARGRAAKIILGSLGKSC